MACNFTFNHYTQLLNTALHLEYRIVSLSEYLDNCAFLGKTLVLRHDVDSLPDKALEMARIEDKFGIHSTYFFRVFSNEYNIYGYDTMCIIKELEKMGHEVGYHAEPKDVAVACHIDAQDAYWLGKQALELLLGHPVNGAASHREATGNNNLTEFFAYYTPEQLGLKYEADSPSLGLFNSACYLTDGYEWYWRRFEHGTLTNDTRCACKILEEVQPPLLYCLIHPNNWYHQHLHHRIKL